MNVETGMKTVDQESTILKEARAVIDLIKGRCLNEEGHIVRLYPQKEGTIYADFDDLVPFFLYFGEDEFIARQIKISKEATFHGLTVFNGKIVSWRNDEYLGALCSFYRKHPESWLKAYIEETFDYIKKYLFYENHIIAYYDLERNKKSKIYSPWAGGLLEVFLENSDLFPEWREAALKVTDQWLQSESFKRYGLFTAKNHVNSRIFNRVNTAYKTKSRHLNHSLWNTTGYYLNRKKSFKEASLESLFNLLFEWPTGFHFQFMKLNSNFVFALIEAFKVTKSKSYQQALDFWISSVKEKLYRDGFLSGDWNPVYKEHAPPRMADHFTMIDILCDYYAFVEQKPEYLNWAKDLADQWLMVALPCGLYPPLLGQKVAHIDSQMDFSISLRRVGEIAGRGDYIEKGTVLFDRALQLFRKETGFITLVDQEGNPKKDYIEIKYNALLLKGLINKKEIDKKIYQNPWLHDLLKDR